MILIHWVLYYDKIHLTLTVIVNEQRGFTLGAPHDGLSRVAYDIGYSRGTIV